MYINTRTKESMEQSLHRIFNISNENLNILFSKIKETSIENQMRDSKKIDYLVDEFICRTVFTNSLERILFFHFGRRLNTVKNKCDGKNLFELLISENAFSAFLKIHDITFRVNENYLDLFYKEKKVCLEDVEKNHVPYLRGRLGYIGDKGDYCFNGFMFGDQLLQNNYFCNLRTGPEIIKALSYFLNKPEIGKEYIKRSDYYVFEYLVPIERVIFDNAEMLNIEDKKRYLLKEVLLRLFDYYLYAGNLNDVNNPILRLADDDEMDANFFIKKEKYADD